MLGAMFAQIRERPIRFAHSPRDLDALQNYLMYGSRMLSMPHTLAMLNANQSLGSLARRFPMLHPLGESFLQEGHPVDLMAMHDLLHQEGEIPYPEQFQPDSEHPYGQFGAHLMRSLKGLLLQHRVFRTSPFHIGHFMGTEALDESNLPQYIHQQYGHHPGTMKNVPGMVDRHVLPWHALDDTMQHAMFNAFRQREASEDRGSRGVDIPGRRIPTMLHYADPTGQPYLPR